MVTRGDKKPFFLGREYSKISFVDQLKGTTTYNAFKLIYGAKSREGYQVEGGFCL